MAVIIGVVSQKGGSGKSTICRLVACSFAADGWDVKIADLDISQGTTFHWHRDRVEAGIQPEIAVESFSAVRRALGVRAGRPRAGARSRRPSAMTSLLSTAPHMPPERRKRSPRLVTW